MLFRVADVKLSSLNYRAAKPGMNVIQKSMLIGATLLSIKNIRFVIAYGYWMISRLKMVRQGVVPKSHKLNMLPSQSLEDILNEHPDEIKITGPAFLKVFIILIPMYGMVGLRIIPRSKHWRN